MSPTAEALTAVATAVSNGINENGTAPKPKSNKKKTATVVDEPEPTSPAATSAAKTKTKKKTDAGGGGGSLVICRNKHWKYISSFHGPWLQLPPEVLESLAYHNFATARPHPIDPAVFFDLVKIRRLVDDATNISVRAASGVTSSSISNGYLPSMHGSNANILGIGLSNPGSQAKLSRERKHRMRELATQKLAKAYILDEIATSVAMMQGASTLEDVAGHVLERSPNDMDAKYVHFFHEKIPSRMMASNTSLRPLTEIIADKPWEGAILRTRAVTKGFKDDYAGAAMDLTAALKVCKIVHVHDASSEMALTADNGALVTRTARGKNGAVNAGSVWSGPRDDSVHPSSLEMQLVFHRAGVHLTMACQRAETFINMTAKMSRKDSGASNGSQEPPITQAKLELERKAVRTNAKKALRDYLKYLSHFDYTPGLPWQSTIDFLKTDSDLLDEAGRISDVSDDTSIIPFRKSSITPNRSTDRSDRPNIPPRGPVYPVSTLFSSTPPDLPPYPRPQGTADIYTPLNIPDPSPQQANAMLMHSHEAITYHPLLTDALHSLLLSHVFIATSPKELQRHAFTVARLARVCDGYPIFLAARSPARADWIEVLRRVPDIVDLHSSWESLCAPAPLPNPSPGAYDERGGSDDRGGRGEYSNGSGSVSSGTGNGMSSRALSALMSKENNNGTSQQVPKRWAQEDGREYPISTERASLLAKYVKDERKVCGNKPNEGKEVERNGEKVVINGKEGERIIVNGNAHIGKTGELKI